MQTAPGAADPARDKYTTIIFWLLAAVVVATAFSFRMSEADHVMRPDGTIRFGDIDTMRRLDRLRAIDGASSYPVIEIKDGFPNGTISHWTRPFDWCLRVLNPVLLPFVPGASGYEAAAVLAGPVLGTLCVILFLWFAVRLMGRFPGLLATLFYALQFPLLTMSAVGNGDHQNLQHLVLLIFGWLWVLDRAGKIGAGAAPLSGFALGMGIWISTESMLMFLTWVGVTGVMALVRPPSREELRPEIRRGAALLITLLVGAAFEQTSFWAIEWDKVSWFQIYPVLVFLAFLVLARCLERSRARIWIAAAIALGAGLLGLLTGFGTEVRVQLATFDDANVWLQTTVNEFRSSFWDGAQYSVAEGLRRFTYVLLGLPVFLAAVLMAKPLAPGARVTLAALTTIAFGLAAWEVKLSHFFAVWFPVAVVVGGMVLRERLVPRDGPARIAGNLAFAVLLIVCGFLGSPKGPDLVVRTNKDGIAEICEFLAKQNGKRDGSVLAAWDLAGAILYHAGWPVVASGYHRNLAGIKDAYRYFSLQPDEVSLENEILQRRKVRFVVAWYSRVFLQHAQVVLGSGKSFIAGAGAERAFTELAKNCLFWRLRYHKNLPGYRLRYSSTIGIPVRSAQPEPLFQIYEVTR